MRSSAAVDLSPQLSALSEGLGSAYERFAVNRLLERLAETLGVQTVAEWPANGVLGVPGIKSLALARSGRSVTLLHPSAVFLDDVDEIWRAAGMAPPARLVARPEDGTPGARGAFDLVWSFCALEHTDDPAAVARAMLRASRGHVLVFVQNAWAPGVHLHGLQHLARRQPWDHGRIADMRAEAVARHLTAAGGEIVELGGCDLPPWPDLNVRLPRAASAGAPDLVPRPRRYGPGDPIMTTAAVARAFRSPPPLPGVVRALMGWHDLVEARVPTTLLRWLAHHPYVLARPRSGPARGPE